MVSYRSCVCKLVARNIGFARRFGASDASGRRDVAAPTRCAGPARVLGEPPSLRWDSRRFAPMRRVAEAVCSMWPGARFAGWESLGVMRHRLGQRSGRSVAKPRRPPSVGGSALVGGSGAAQTSLRHMATYLYPDEGAPGVLESRCTVQRHAAHRPGLRIGVLVGGPLSGPIRARLMRRSLITYLAPRGREKER